MSLKNSERTPPVLLQLMDIVAGAKPEEGSVPTRPESKQGPAKPVYRRLSSKTPEKKAVVTIAPGHEAAAAMPGEGTSEGEGSADDASVVGVASASTVVMDALGPEATKKLVTKVATTKEPATKAAAKRPAACMVEGQRPVKAMNAAKIRSLWLGQGDQSLSEGLYPSLG